jgi:hypothetical protein
VGEVIKVIREAPEALSYHVHFSGRSRIQVPERALGAPGDRSDSDEDDP